MKATVRQTIKIRRRIKASTASRNNESPPSLSQLLRRSARRQAADDGLLGQLLAVLQSRNNQRHQHTLQLADAAYRSETDLRRLQDQNSEFRGSQATTGARLDTLERDVWVLRAGRPSDLAEITDHEWPMSTNE